MRADYGLVAYENSTEGPVNEVLDRLVDTPLQICAEVSLPIAHTLLSRATSMSTIKRVLCHPQTAGQTRLWLAEHLPGVAVLPSTSNGKAAELAAQDTTGTRGRDRAAHRRRRVPPERAGRQHPGHRRAT